MAEGGVSAEPTRAGVVARNLVIKQLPLGKRIRYYAAAVLLSKLFPVLTAVVERLGRLLGYISASAPDIVKSYPARKNLTVRIFIPPSATPGAKLPTLLTIHGGGFLIGSPSDNDAWNRQFADAHSFLVVALDYRKSPFFTFPTPVYDLEALIACVLADGTLPLDPARVAVAGFSAGGNLSLAVSQLPSVRPRIRAAVPVYPVVDLSEPSAHKLLTRPYKPRLGGFRGSPADFLKPLIGVFNWAYLDVGQRTDDPLLSPFYASPDALPSSVFIVACELDMLAAEAWRMACRLAGKPVPSDHAVVGAEDHLAGHGKLITQGDERYAWEVVLEGGKRRYRWLLVPDTTHAFDQEGSRQVALDPVFAEDAVEKTKLTIDLIGKWLLDGPLKVEEA
ncbi:hypothetical protein VTJ83DRAFT_5150 [Remersonia thermophila]|uniref:Alpha/beta hydrolase fold-3 domain-containing protein n=1 Tax=Remersonia thermophila TaxID=72144 RepID=A0ABR4DC19_9PEZI